METLNVTRININAPYKVWNEGSIYRFETDNGIKYLVDFELDSNPFYTAYWFNLTNPEHTKSPGDIKIAKTVVGNYMTSLDMAGFSVTLLKLDDELKGYLNAPADTPAYKEV